ncbi:AraC family transcriptional regulator [Pedobacter sp. P351]|uniref:AraC family transcriptional regulator n=1 Tax=Pedobacter superstes TaxID=3133441 RepID=UPI0030A3E33A
MENFYRYLPVSKEDEQWGLHILNTGYTHIENSTFYPSKKHPYPYFFNCNTGRVLQEYQLIYITRGEGFFESAAAGKKAIQAGDAILLFPGDRHSYKPNEKTGWDEYWIGFNGNIIDNQVSNRFFKPDDPVFRLGLQYEIIALFESIIEQTKQEKPAYQQIISGMLLHLLGSVYSRKKQSSLSEDNEVIHVVNKAMVLFRQNITEQISPEIVARQLGIGYSLFRKLFKNHTGLAPGQYLIQLRIEKAKQMLTGSSKPVKEIAYELSFDSGLYFSKVFRQKTGLSPQQFRKQGT